MPNFFFLHVPSGRSWPTDDPHQWLKDHGNYDLLAAARERLLLSPDDSERCLRVALRRCGLVLIQIVNESQIVVRHCSGQSPDLRMWAKEYGFNRTGVQVVFEDVKNSKIVVHKDAEDVLLFGVRVGPKFPWPVYAMKFEMRHAEEADDHDAAPASATNFVWENRLNERFSWEILKTIWRAETGRCPNCDRPLLMMSFEWQLGMLSFRSGRSIRVCPWCRRRFEAVEEKPLAWVASVLPPTLRPTHLRLWDTIAINWPHLSLGNAQPVQVADREE